MTALSQLNQENLKIFEYHFAMKQNALKHDDTLKNKLCYEDYPGSQASRQHWNTRHGFPVDSAKADPNDTVNE